MSSSSQEKMAYALHTGTCTYLLDEAGVCRWIVSPQGAVPAHVRQAIGAQFVACLDPATAGGLVGDLKVGSMALFVRQLDDRMVLLRTATIQNVDDRRGDKPKAGERPELPPPAAPMRPTTKAYGKAGGLPYMAKPPPRISVVEHVGEEQTITVTLTGPTKVVKGWRR